MGSDLKRLKVELLCEGIVLDDSARGFFKRSMGFPLCINGSIINPPFYYAGFERNRHPYVKHSIFSLNSEDGKWFLSKNGKRLTGVEVAQAPSFYNRLTSDGIEMRRVAPLCGDDCLLTGVIQNCDYWKRGEECKFCGIPLNTYYEKRLPKKTPRQLLEVIETGVAEGRIKRIRLSIGGQEKDDKGAGVLLECAKAIKERFNTPIQVELLPPSEKHLEMLAGYVDCFNTNIEIFDPAHRSNLMPGKSKLPLEEYYKILKSAVDIFGEHQVQSVIIAGLEGEDTLQEGCDKLASFGVFPSVTPFRPTSGTALENEKPPDARWMAKQYERIGEIVKTYGLRPEKNNGCERCGGCSALKEYAI